MASSSLLCSCAVLLHLASCHAYPNRTPEPADPDARMSWRSDGRISPARTTAPSTTPIPTDMNLRLHQVPGRGFQDSATKLQDPAAGAAGAGKPDLASQATNPASPLVQFQLQNIWLPENNDSRSNDSANQFIVQPVIPVSAMGWFPRSVWRPTIPILNTPDLEFGSVQIAGTSGLGDISLIGGPVIDYDWGMIVVGPAIVFPSATDERLGERQWQLGPLVGPIATKVIPHMQFGALVWNQWGLGGVGDGDLNQMTVQPILNYHFSEGWYTGVGDYAYTFNWETDDNYLPVSAKVGRVFAMGQQHVNVFFTPFYNVGDDIPGSGKWGFKLSFTLLLPTGA